jgi:hypothetical protein
MDLMARTCNYDLMGGERLSARLFVALGGIFWVIAALSASAIYNNEGFVSAAGAVLLPFALAAVALIIGWFYENVAAVLLFVGAVATVVWGFVAQWEAGVWGLMAIVLIAPTIIAGVLFLMAAQMQGVCEDRGTTKV